MMTQDETEDAGPQIKQAVLFMVQHPSHLQAVLFVVQAVLFVEGGPVLEDDILVLCLSYFFMASGSTTWKKGSVSATPAWGRETLVFRAIHLLCCFHSSQLVLFRNAFAVAVVSEEFSGYMI